jgi:hypothetical protein
VLLADGTVKSYDDAGHADLSPTTGAVNRMYFCTESRPLTLQRGTDSAAHGRVSAYAAAPDSREAADWHGEHRTSPGVRSVGDPAFSGTGSSGIGRCSRTPNERAGGE